MSEKQIPELAVRYMENAGSLEEIRSYSIREMDNFLLKIKHECSRLNILRVAGNFKIDHFAQDPVTTNKRALLTSDFAKIGTPVRYKKNNRYNQVAMLYLAICCGQFGLPLSQFYWTIFSQTTSKTNWDFDETLVELSRKDPTSRFYNKIKQIDEDTILFHAVPVDPALTVEAATKDIMAVATFIYSADDVFVEKWKDQMISDKEDDISKTISVPRTDPITAINQDIAVV